MVSPSFLILGFTATVSLINAYGKCATVNGFDQIIIHLLRFSSHLRFVDQHHKCRCQQVIRQKRHNYRKRRQQTEINQVAHCGKGKDGKPTRDPEAGWHVKSDSRGRKKSTYGFSVHTGVDEDGFIQRQSVTAGNVHDSQERDTLLLGDETALYADAAYSSQQTRDKLGQLGIDDQVQRKGYRGKPLSDKDRKRNQHIAVVRAGGERPFATYKWHYGLARTRFMGLAKNMTVYGLAAMAANIRKGAILRQTVKSGLYGLEASVP